MVENLAGLGRRGKRVCKSVTVGSSFYNVSGFGGDVTRVLTFLFYCDCWPVLFIVEPQPRKGPISPWFTAQVTAAVVRTAFRWPSHMEGNCLLFYTL